jgi:hypothetical protein
VHQENNATFIRLNDVAWVTADGEYGFGEILVFDAPLKHLGDLHESHRLDYALEAVTNGEAAAIQEWETDIA